MPETLTIACKLPHGLLLQHQIKEQENEPVMGGGFRKVDRWRKTGGTIRINGWAKYQGAEPKCQTAHGFALTHNVPSDFWNEWVKQNPDYEPLKNGQLFAAGSASSVEGKARETALEKSGFERMDPKNLPAEFKRTISTATH